MLKFIIGISGTGKTYEMLREIKELAKQGKKSVLIVPEQFSSTSESMINSELEDEYAAFVHVFSFTSFAELLLKKFGGVSISTMTDAAKVITVRRAANSLADKLNVYFTQRKNINFCTMCAQTINELKTAGASAQQLLSISNSKDNLKEIAYIFTAYEGLIKGVALDTQDRITLSLKRANYSFFSEYSFFVEGFEGFTAPQYKMLDAIIQNADCTISLCTDSLVETQGGFGIFSSVKKTAMHLKQMASKENIKVKAPKVMKEDYRHIHSETLKALNLILCDNESYNSDIDFKSENFNLTFCKNKYDECKTVAVQIAHIVAKGAKYNEIAVICRDVNDYAQILKHEFSLMQVPYFLDNATTIEHKAITSFIRCALQLASKGKNSETIIRMLKTGLFGVDAQDIMALENYAYTWQIKSDEWNKPFTKNPAGFGDFGGNIKKEDAVTLEKAENLRKKVMPFLNVFLNNVSKSANNALTATDISKAVYKLLTDINAEENTLNAAKLLGFGSVEKSFATNEIHAQSYNLGEEIFRTWNITMGLLDEINSVFAQEKISAKEYEEIFALLILSHDVGHVPQTNNTVIITSADRMKLKSPKYSFVLGLNEGEFPKTVGFSGLLTHEDREDLVKIGINMPGDYENRILLERMFFYKALTSSSHGLYLSAISPDYGGAGLCSEIEQAVQILAPAPLSQTVAQKSYTVNSALDLLSSLYRKDTVETASLYKALSENEHAKNSIEIMKSLENKQSFKARKKATIEKLLGKSITISPTGIEQFNKCRFAYFANYILRLKSPKKAELSPLESGSFVHYVIENTMRQAGKEFAFLSKSDLEELANKIADDYVEHFMPENTQRFNFLIARLKEGINRLLLFMQEEQKQSEFKPVAFEQEIGFSDNAVKPLELKTDDGKTISVIGKIDRVDVMQTPQGPFLRVVDYKTGEKKFKLEDVYCGLDTQMLFYLFALCNSNHELYKEHKPAGVLYVLTDPAPESGQRENDSKTKVFRVDGMVLDNDYIIRGMDSGFTGFFVPFSFRKDNTPFNKTKLTSAQKLANIEKHLTQTVLNMAKDLFSGEIKAVALRSTTTCPCDYCEYRPICRHEDGIDEVYISAPKDAFE